MTELRTTKTLLAKLMAEENLNVEHANVSTASFNPETRTVTIPNWDKMSPELYDLMASHEVGHARYTPTEGWAKAAENSKGKGYKSFLNVVEDARIEKKMKLKYPGLRKSYRDGYNELLEGNFFGIADKDLDDMNIIDKLNIYFKAGVNSGITFTDEEQTWVDQLSKISTWDDTVDLADRLYDYAKDKLNNPQDPEDHDDLGNHPDGTNEDGGDDFPEDGDTWEKPEEKDEHGESDEQEGDDTNAGDTEEEGDDQESDSNKTDGDDSDDDGEGDGGSDSDDEEGDDEDGTGDSDDTDEEGVNNTKTKASNGKEGGTKNGNHDIEPTSETDEAWQKNQEKLSNASDSEFNYYNVPSKFDTSHFVVDYKEVLKDFAAHEDKLVNDKWRGSTNHLEENKIFLDGVQNQLNKFKISNKKVVAYLAKEFEMKKSADEYRRTATSKTGVLDTTKLHSYKYNDDIFKKVAHVADGKNHGLVMFVDWSGSMCKNMLGTIEQLINLVLFCKKVNIPFEVYSFTDNYAPGWVTDPEDARLAENPEYKMPHQVGFQPKDILPTGSLRLRNYFSSRMNSRELTTAMFHVYKTACAVEWRYDYTKRNIYYVAGCYVDAKDGLGGTPMDSAILVATKLVPEFQRKTGVDIANVVLLTDGSSHNYNNFLKSDNTIGYYNPWNYKAQQNIFRDANKNEYTAKKDAKVGYSDHNSRRLTGMHINMLKKIAGVNVLGFYIDDLQHVKHFLGNLYPNSWEEEPKKKVKEIKKEKFLIYSEKTAQYGYSELYLMLGGDGMKIEEEELPTGEEITHKKLRSAFVKQSSKKVTSRVILTAFIDQIS